MYFIFARIDLLAFPPITRTDYANNFFTIGKAHSENVFSKAAKAIVPFLSRTVCLVFRDNTTREALNFRG